MIAPSPNADADYLEHVAFYHSFLRFVIGCISAIAVLLILMAYFLT